MKKTPKGDTKDIPYGFEREEYLILPDIVEFSSTISKSGKKKVINVPAGFRDLVEEGESINVRLEFPFRKIAKIKNEMQKVKRR